MVLPDNKVLLHIHYSIVLSWRSMVKEQNLKLEEKHYDILQITGLSFLDLNEEKFRSVGFALGPATLLAKEAKALKDNTKRPFSSYE